MKLGLVACLTLVACTSAAPDRAVPVEDEPHHKTVFRNEYVQAFRVQLEPGTTSLMHIHSRDDAAVRLSTATVAADSPGEPIGPDEPVYPGMVSARDNEAKPKIHRVHNIGATLFDVVDVQILKRPEGAEAAPISTPDAANAKMRLYRYELEPGASSAQHTHARPYLLVAVTAAELRMTSPDGATMDHPVKVGDMHWVDSAVTHTFTNRGSGKTILVEFELK
jgi:beta-alanine degradation protein BauB